MKIPVVLVTGFLGSGKTTFLKSLARKHQEKKIVFLVNEYAEISLDSGVLAETGVPIHSVVGGSLFCECKSADFIKVMKAITGSDQVIDNPDIIVIETSGIADPESIGNLIALNGLDEHLEVRQIVTIVSPGRFETLLDNLPVVSAQISASGLVVVNKADLVDQDCLTKTQNRIRQLNPNTTIEIAKHCDFEWNLERSPTPLPSKQLDTCDSNPFTSVVAYQQSMVTEETLEKWLQEIPDYILRVKGHLKVDDKYLHIEKTVDTLYQEWVEGDHESAMVFIVNDPDEEKLTDFLSNNTLSFQQ